MKTSNIISTLLFTLYFINTGNLVFSSNDQKDDQSNAILVRIQQIAEKMEVFPVDIYASAHQGPLGLKAFVSKDTSLDPRVAVFSDWQYRYELTFDRFIPLFELKECVYNASVDDLDDCIDRIEEMTPKEKTLLFAVIYNFEYRYRHVPAYDQPCTFIKKLNNDSIDQRRDHLDPQMIKYYEECIDELWIGVRVIGYKPDESIDKEVWSRWLAVIEKYKDDKTVVFPAIDTPLKEMKNEWQLNIENCEQFTSDKWHLPWQSLGCNPSRTKDYHILLASLRYDSPQEARLLRMYGEYYDVFYNKLKSGSGFYSGNSSLFPKTLGDIATQILMSRLNYDDIPDTGMLE